MARQDSDSSHANNLKEAAFKLEDNIRILSEAQENGGQKTCEHDKGFTAKQRDYTYWIVDVKEANHFSLLCSFVFPFAPRSE